MTIDNILKIFSEKPVRETSGPRSANRFDYQKNWSLCELLALHAKTEDYLMVFEHHEDVVIFDSSSSPSSAIFYQIKTKSPGNWTVGALSKADKNGQSIVSKLYTSYEKFPNFVNELVFSSNAGLSTTLANNSKALGSKSIRFMQLSNEDKEKIRNSAEGNEKEFCSLDGLNKVVIKVADLPLSDHTATAKGKVVEFFEQEYPNNTVHVALIYKTIFDEIRRKTNYENPCTFASEIIEKKSISRSEFENIIGVILNGRTANELWSDANQMLITEGFKPLEIRAFRSQWQNYVVDRMNATDESLIELQKLINSCLNDIEHYSPSISVKNLLAEVLNKVRLLEHFNFYDDHYVQAAALYEVLKDDSVSKANTKP